MRKANNSLVMTAPARRNFNIIARPKRLGGCVGLSCRRSVVAAPTGRVAQLAPVRHGVKQSIRHIS